jgi:FMN reductase
MGIRAPPAPANDTVPNVRVVAVNGSPSTTSKTHALAAAALELAGGGTLVNVSDLDADALLLRRQHESVGAAIDALVSAEVLVLVTPVYRATYSGLLKVVLDQLPTDALRGTAVVLAATAGSGAHYLALDTGLRAAVASLAGWSVPTVAYATGDDFDADGNPGARILDALRQGVEEARTVAGR